MATLRDVLAPGSYLVISHGTNDRPARRGRAPSRRVYNRSVATALHLRSRQDILRFFDGFGVVDPGLVYIPEWRPEPGDDLPEHPGRPRRKPGSALLEGLTAADVMEGD